METNQKAVSKLALIQRELKAPKGQYNSFGKYRYRSCEDILEALKPICAAHGCAVVLSDALLVLGDRYYIEATATLLDGESGERITNTSYAREDADKKGMDGSQITGAASSYARKYALNGLFAIDDAKDADTDAYTSAGAGENEPQMVCTQCGNVLTQTTAKDGRLWSAAEQAGFSERRFGRVLCPACMSRQNKQKESEPC